MDANKPINEVHNSQLLDPQSPQKPLLEIEGKTKTDLEGDLKISEDSSKSSSIEVMGKLNILEWVKQNMPKEYENGEIESVTPEKMTDENGNPEWRLIDVKDPKTKDSGEETKTFLEIQTTWVIKTKDGQIRRPTQFLKTGVTWPKEDSVEQLQAIKRATIAIDLYTHTMARPLYKKDSELPEGFRFADLVMTKRLSVNVQYTGTLRDQMKVEIATPKGQGGQARAITYELSEMVNRTAVPLLNRSAIHHDTIDVEMINRQARHAVVKESSGREVNPEDREAYLNEEELGESYNQTPIDEFSYSLDMQDVLKDQRKLDKLLTYMGKDRERHIVDFNVANDAIHSGPTTRVLTNIAKKREQFAKSVMPIYYGKTQQQALGKFLEDKKDLEKLNTLVTKQEEKIKALQIKVDQAKDRKKKDAYTNQLDSAEKELTELRGEQIKTEKAINNMEKGITSYIARMQHAHDFLQNKFKQYEHLALFIAAKAAEKTLYVKNIKEEIDIYDIGKIAENYTLDELLKEGKGNLSSAEHYFISTFIGSKGGRGVPSRKGMAAEMERMQKIIDQVCDQLII